MKLNQKARVRHKRNSSKAFGRQLLAPLLRTMKGVAERASLSNQIAKERSALRGLSDHQLKDIGLTRDQAESEYSRGFYDMPSEQRNSDGFLLGGSGRSGRSKISRLPEE